MTDKDLGDVQVVDEHPQSNLQQSYIVDNYAGQPNEYQAAANDGGYNIMPSIYNSLKDSYNYVTGAEDPRHQVSQ